MPLSKKRKKKGRAVSGRGAIDRKRRREELDQAERPSGVSLQDLINVVAYQDMREKALEDAAEPEKIEVTTIEYEGIDALALMEAAYLGDDTVIAEDATINMPGEIPVTVGEGEEKRRIGTAYPMPGEPGKVNVTITDPHLTQRLSDGAYSMKKETE